MEGSRIRKETVAGGNRLLVADKKKNQIRVASEYLLKASPRHVALGITCHFLVQLLRIMKSYSIDAVL